MILTKMTYTVYVEGEGYVLSFNETKVDDKILRFNWEFDDEKAALLTEADARAVLVDVRNANSGSWADKSCIRPMSVISSSEVGSNRETQSGLN